MKRSTLSIVIICMTMCSARPIQGQKPTTDRYRDELQPAIERFVKQENVPGLAIAIVENNRIVYAQGFGVIRLGSTDKVTDRTLFQIASTTKPFVATAIMQLVEKGLIDLDAPLVKYLPYFRLDDDRSKAITIRQMLTHTSGFPDVVNYEYDKPQSDDGALERYVRSLSTQKLLFDPGSKYAYSNIAFDVLGDVIAKVSGETFEGYIRKHILTPLKMKDSTLLLSEADPKLRASAHIQSDTGEISVSKYIPYNRIHAPDGTMFTSVTEMARWAMANMNRGELDGQRILSDKSYVQMWTPARTDAVPRNWRYVKGIGLCWALGEYQGHLAVWHAGGDLGFVADFVMIPDKKIAVIWMMNADWPKRVTLTNTALDIALKPQ